MMRFNLLSIYGVMSEMFFFNWKLVKKVCLINWHHDVTFCRPNRLIELESLPRDCFLTLRADRYFLGRSKETLLSGYC